MSIKLNHGGPAFPFAVDHGDKLQVFTGMTLRDYFAGQALPSKAENYHPDAAAKLAYEYADAMLEAREVKP